MSTEDTVAALNAAHLASQDPGPRPIRRTDPLALDAITAPTPSLHPGVIEAIDGYETDKGYVQGAHEAFTKAHAAIQHVIDARTALNANTDWSVEQKLIKLAALADQRQDEAAKAFDGALKRLNDGIKAYEEMLTNPLDQKAGLGTVNTEMRDHCKRLPSGKREAFLSEAIEHKDTKTLLAICGAAHYLSGLTRKRHALLTRQYHLMTNPEIEKRLHVMRAARTHIEEKGPLILTQMEHAIGYKRTKVTQARQRHKAAEDALKIA